MGALTSGRGELGPPFWCLSPLRVGVPREGPLSVVSVPGPRGSWGCRGAGGPGWAAGGVVCPGLGGGPWCSLSCLLSSLFLLLLPPPLPALLLPRVWPWAVPTYGPYGRFCSLSACLSCMSVLVTVIGTPLCLVLSPRAPEGSAQSTLPRAALCRARSVLPVVWHMPCVALGHSTHSWETKAISHVQGGGVQAERQARVSPETWLRAELSLPLSVWPGLG